MIGNVSSVGPAVSGLCGDCAGGASHVVQVCSQPAKGGSCTRVGVGWGWEKAGGCRASEVQHTCSRGASVAGVQQ